MRGAIHHPILTRLADDLWPASGFGRRSEELSPLYADRFHGPRIAGPRNPHPFWEMGTVKEGVGELRAAGVLPLHAAMTFLIPPGLGHTEFAAGNIDIIWIEHAMRLLEHSHLPVSDVARQSGYDDPFYFCRVFQKLVGTSPLRYRQSRRPGA